MSKPASGTYVIVNRVLSPNGEKLVITFNGEGKAATVAPLSDSASQRWIIADYNDKTQSVSPTSAKNLQAAWGSGFVSVIPAGNYVWTIRSSDTGYTIQDGGVTVFWGVADAHSNAQVTIGNGTGNEKQRWVLEKA